MHIDEVTKTAAAHAKLAARIKQTEAKLEPLREDLKALEAKLLNALVDSGMQAVRTKGGATYAVTRRTITELYDADAFFGWVAKRKAWDLIPRRCNVEGARLRWEDGVIIPGVRPGEVSRLSITHK